MAVRRENQCVGCPPEIGCLGRTCPKRDVPVFVCDRCGEEVAELFDTDGGDLCLECAKDELTAWDLEEAVRNTFNELKEDE